MRDEIVLGKNRNSGIRSATEHKGIGVVIVEKETKPFAFRAPVDLAIEFKVAALRSRQTIEAWCLDAAKRKLKAEQEASTRAA